MHVSAPASHCPHQNQRLLLSYLLHIVTYQQSPQSIPRMSFGFSAGDFVAVGQLAWTTYRACKSAPGEFQELARELSSLHIILRELEEEASSPTSLLNRRSRGKARKPEWDLLRMNVEGILKDIGDIAQRYESLGRDQKRTWDRVGFATQDLVALRGKLSVHIGAIQVFIGSLSAGSLAWIEDILDELVRDIKAGRKEPSVISSCKDDTEDDEVAWTELERELIGDGITKQDVERHKDDIKQYLQKLIRENLRDIEPESPDVEGSSDDESKQDSLFATALAEPLVVPRQDSEGSSASNRTKQASEILQEIKIRTLSFRDAIDVTVTSSKSAEYVLGEVFRVVRKLGLGYNRYEQGLSCTHTYLPAPVPGKRSRSRPEVSFVRHLEFNIIIGKVPLLSVYGVKFKRITPRGTSVDHLTYTDMVAWIVRALRI